MDIKKLKQIRAQIRIQEIVKFVAQGFTPKDNPIWVKLYHLAFASKNNCIALYNKAAKYYKQDFNKAAFFTVRLTYFIYYGEYRLYDWHNTDETEQRELMMHVIRKAGDAHRDDREKDTRYFFNFLDRKNLY